MVCVHAKAQQLNPATDSESVGGDSEDLVKDVIHDQKSIWTSPFHINRESAWDWIFAGAGTAALLAADHPLLQALPHRGTVKDTGADLSDLGNYYAVYPAAAAMYAFGRMKHDDKLRDTGFLSGEALIDADLVTLVFKVAARRERPYQRDGGGHFETGGSSFPSGHSAQAWALASVIAHEYGDHKWVPVAAYTYASGVSVARILAQDHFASDVFVGGAIGFFVGRFVAESGKRHFNHLWTHMPQVQAVTGNGVKTVELAWNY